MRSCRRSACFLLLMDSQRPHKLAVCGDSLDGWCTVGPRCAYRHSVLEQSTKVTLEGSDWTNESDVTLLHIVSTVRRAYLIYST
ncbi:hypothetical protein AVEN_208084-1 [Araneus ventricosus]|uniref:C3H1-type domain-containing protein n=1 Tax=Araneus ventricosus TaxID=182803 RepID=A0A4Y2FW50_ARAVE|nr:hypothetical protein AVEN_208084-1 [Araneus ventricosus]